MSVEFYAKPDGPAASPARRLIAVLVVLAVAGLGAGYGVAKSRKPHTIRIGEPARKVEEPKIFVHVAGAVNKPGVYPLVRGARVGDAVDAAGGALPDADIDSVNLASKIRDGDKVLVPGRGTPTESKTDDRVNINTATPTELDTLPGVGPSTAEKIIAYRKAHGGFRDVKDLQKVPGIGPRRFEQLAPLITV